MSLFGIDHKTVFVLDHGPAMLESSKYMVDFDIFTKSRPQGVVPLAQVSKSLWSCCMEALCEYCRIVWDIFPNDKLLRFIVSDSSSKTLNNWSNEGQSMSHLMKSLASVGPPLRKTDCSVMLGLVSAVEALCDPTPAQEKFLVENSNQKVQNEGRIVCITQLRKIVLFSTLTTHIRTRVVIVPDADHNCRPIVSFTDSRVKSDAHRRTLEDCVADAVSRHCVMAEESGRILSLDRVNLVLIHVKPFGSDCSITECAPAPMSSYPKLITESHDVKSTRHGIAIANRLLNLLQYHYDLSVTSITGIPMKEEQHANSSANYDVLLLHRRLPGTRTSIVDQTIGDGELNSTMLLKWCTPKINVDDLYHCTGAARISPVDVNSRPSLCLTNFLLNGRSVLLEHWQKGPDGSAGSSFGDTNHGLKTHMISCRGSDIFLHALGVTRTPFEDPPSISEGPGGKITDYRINDFGNIIKEVQLLPLAGRLPKPQKGNLNRPLDGAIAKLNRLTQCWPLIFSKTIVFNMADAFEPLLETIVKENLTDDDVMDCQRAIYHVIGMEREGNALPVFPTSGTTNRGPGKQSKKDEQYKAMWAELETLLQAHSSTSAKHAEIFDCLVECVGKSVDKSAVGDSNKASQNAVRVPTAPTEIFESPESPPPLKKQKVSSDVTIKLQKGKQSLLSLWNQRVETKNSQRHVEFYGRIASDGNRARLYPNIEEDAPSNNSGTSANHGPRHRFSSHHHRSSSGPRDDTGRSGRLTPQGKQKMKKEKKS